MAGNADVVEEAMQLADDGGDLLGEVAGVHGDDCRASQRPLHAVSIAHARVICVQVGFGSTSSEECVCRSAWQAVVDSLAPAVNERKWCRRRKQVCEDANDTQKADYARTESDAMLKMSREPSRLIAGAAWWSIGGSRVYFGISVATVTTASTPTGPSRERLFHHAYRRAI